LLFFNFYVQGLRKCIPIYSSMLPAPAAKKASVAMAIDCMEADEHVATFIVLQSDDWGLHSDGIWGFLGSLTAMQNWQPALAVHFSHVVSSLQHASLVHFAPEGAAVVVSCTAPEVVGAASAAVVSVEFCAVICCEQSSATPRMIVSAYIVVAIVCCCCFLVIGVANQLIVDFFFAWELGNSQKKSSNLRSEKPCRVCVS
jgi:hypothetical protein